MTIYGKMGSILLSPLKRNGRDWQEKRDSMVGVRSSEHFSLQPIPEQAGSSCLTGFLWPQ